MCFVSLYLCLCICVFFYCKRSNNDIKTSVLRAAVMIPHRQLFVNPLCPPGAYHKGGAAAEGEIELLIYRPQFGTHPCDVISDRLAN